jgi:hypothetical protein
MTTPAHLEIVKSLLLLANTLGVKVASNGINVITVTRSSVPPEVGRWLHNELAKQPAAVLAVIRAEAAS